MKNPPAIFPASILPAPTKVAGMALRRCLDPPKGCGKQVRVDRFVALADGDGRCWKCIHRSKSRRLHSEKAAKVETLARQLLSAKSGKAINTPHISEVCGEMMATFGTTEEFARAWKVEFDRECAGGGPRKTILDAFSGLSKLVALSTQHRATAPDVLDMDRDDMVQELLGILTREDRESVVKILNETEITQEIMEEEDDDHIAQSA